MNSGTGTTLFIALLELPYCYTINHFSYGKELGQILQYFQNDLRCSINDVTITICVFLKKLTLILNQ